MALYAVDNAVKDLKDLLFPETNPYSAEESVSRIIIYLLCLYLYDLIT